MGAVAPAGACRDGSVGAGRLGSAGCGGREVRAQRDGKVRNETPALHRSVRVLFGICAVFKV